MLASLFNVPQAESEFDDWSFTNMDQHRQITDALARQRSITLPLYALDPIPPSDVLGWLEIHQDAHAAFTQALGIGGFDLTDVDFQNTEQLAAWIRLHALEHQQAAQILGLS